ncbi:FtsX-like permease family protein [uncultured Desulfosarcina sp.]|uniref:ABC transporter permease n=1 Tax=uncultured Desulfosarcina sp. TaxID=218289 RepID=UPI0029C6C506|nr:FtsX-like permease family protein [uncultured Desulfosarcina sp.]
MRHLPTVIRQVRRSSTQAVLFVLCVALSLSALTAFSGFGRSVKRALQDDARILHAADILVRSYDPISTPLIQATDRLVEQARVRRAMVHEFYSVVRDTGKTASVLSRLKVVEPGYPFYGQVSLKSGRPFPQVLTPGACIVEQTLLDRIGLQVGDHLQVGYAALTIADVVTGEPDRPLELFAFGPRVFLHNDDLESLGLMATGSRIRRTLLLQVADPLEVDAIAEELQRAAAEGGERIDTYRTAGSAVTRFFDMFLFFLKLVGLFILMISGIGIQSTLTALINEKRPAIAIMKTVGATGRFITTHFLFLVLVLGAIGTVAGIVAGGAMQAVLTWMLGSLLPGGLSRGISWAGVAEAVLMGAVVVVLFSFVPLYRARQMRPLVLFKRETAPDAGRWPTLLSAVLILLFFLFIVLWHMRDVRFGIAFVGALAGMVLAAGLLAQLVLAIIRRLPVRHLAMRQAIRGLFRRGNATRAVMITLTVSLALIFGDRLIEKNLRATFVRSFPADSPNAFFVDIQPGQTEAFSAAVGRPVSFYPVVRARVAAINGQAIDRRREGRKRRDNLSRVFNLTYRESLLEDETLLEGDTLFRSDWTEPQVSVMDTVVEMHDMKIGDRIRFTIQGVPITARIASIRTRDNRNMSPFFYFVFPEAVLGKAPQTLFAALKVPSGELGELQTTVVSRLPNISVIDISQTIGTLAKMMERLSRIVRLFSLFSVAAGILILVSAVFATRAERMMESVYYKVLGAGRRFVVTVFALENLLIGLLSSLLALALAQAGAWWVCRMKFDIGYQPFPVDSLFMTGVTVFVVVCAGLAASRSVMAKKPVVYLREQQNE